MSAFTVNETTELGHAFICWAIYYVLCLCLYLNDMFPFFRGSAGGEVPFIGDHGLLGDTPSTTPRHATYTLPHGGKQEIFIFDLV